MTHKQKSWLISSTLLVSGALQFLLSYILPLAGGGASLMLVLTIPILMGCAIIFLFVANLVVRQGRLCDSIFIMTLFHGLLLTFTFYTFPYR